MHWRKMQALILGLGFGILLQSALRHNGRLNKKAELISSACVLATATIAWRHDSTSPKGIVTRPLTQGMACGFLGDVVMGRAIPLPDHVYVPVGMLLFGAGHLAYITAFRALARRRDLWQRNILAPIWALSLAGGVVLWRRCVYNREQAPLSYAALGYGLLLNTMAGIAGGLAIQDTTCIPLALGGALFVTSDLILGARLLRNADFAHRDNLIWLTYNTGQALIIWSAGADATIPRSAVDHAD